MTEKQKNTCKFCKNTGIMPVGTLYGTDYRKCSCGIPTIFDNSNDSRYLKRFNKEDIKEILIFLEEEGSLDEFCNWSEEPNFSCLIEKISQNE